MLDMALIKTLFLKYTWSFMVSLSMEWSNCLIYILVYLVSNALDPEWNFHH